ncbi:uncharacterized protein TNCV_2953951 [Trichonephila clavipes]|nr:uncharacterized protein TNCV_2953951 [Trichonephila clavipes]
MEGYTLLFNHKTKTADWAFECVTKESVSPNTDSKKHKNQKFIPDDTVPSYFRSSIEDFKNSGYSKGHLVPAADQQLTSNSYEDTYILTNIAPMNPAKYEVRSVIRFLHAKGQRPANIHKEIVSVYGNIMNRKNVTKWCLHFSEGRTNVHGKQRTGRPSVISDALLQRTKEAIRANRRLRLKEMLQIIPEVSMTTLYEVVTVKLGYRKLCARWVPKMLTDEHKKKRMGFALDFLTHYAEAGDEFLDHIVTGDETWVYHHTPEFD